MHLSPVCIVVVTQVRVVLQVYRQPGHFDVVLGHLEPGSMASVRVDHVPDRRVHVVGRKSQVCVKVER